MKPKVGTYILPLCAAAFAIVAFGGHAEALVISHSESFIADDTISFSLFDTSLGTLTGVDIDIDSDYTFELVGDGGPPPKLKDFESNHTLSVGSALASLGSGDVFMDWLTAQCTPGGAPPRCNDSDMSSGMLDGDLVALLSATLDLSDFLGVGDFDLTLIMMTTTGGDCGGQSRCDASTSWGGDITVAYTYTVDWLRPAGTVPEPGSLALFFGGLAGLGLMMRRRRSMA